MRGGKNDEANDRSDLAPHTDHRKRSGDEAHKHGASVVSMALKQCPKRQLVLSWRIGRGTLATV